MTAQLASVASVRIDRNPPPRSADATIVVAEYPLNRHQSFRAEIIARDGKSTVSISRWKMTPAGAKRTGQALEFGSHRLQAVADLLADVAAVLETKGGAR